MSSRAPANANVAVSKPGTPAISARAAALINVSPPTPHHPPSGLVTGEIIARSTGNYCEGSRFCDNFLRARARQQFRSSFPVLARRDGADPTKVACEMAMVGEADLRGDQRGANARGEEPARFGDLDLDLKRVRRDA